MNKTIVIEMFDLSVVDLSVFDLKYRERCAVNLGILGTKSQ